MDNIFAHSTNCKDDWYWIDNYEFAPGCFINFESFKFATYNGHKVLNAWKGGSNSVLDCGCSPVHLSEHWHRHNGSGNSYASLLQLHLKDYKYGIKQGYMKIYNPTSINQTYRMHSTRTQVEGRTYGSYSHPGGWFDFACNAGSTASYPIDGKGTSNYIDFWKNSSDNNLYILDLAFYY